MRCQWCGNANPSTATECGSCGRDLAAEESTQDAIDRLEDLQFPETDVVCPSCGSHNFIETEFCTLCNAPLHDDAVWPKRTWKTRRPWGDGLSPRAAIAVLLVVGGLMGACFCSNLSSSAAKAEAARRADAARRAELATQAELEAARARSQWEQERSSQWPHASSSQDGYPQTEQRALPCAIMLPLPSDARLVRQAALNTTSSMVRGELEYVSAWRVADVQALYEGSQVRLACEAQGLRPTSSAYEMQSEPASDWGSYRIPGHYQYGLDISVTSTTFVSGATAVPGSRITIQWRLPTGSSVTAR